MIPADKMPQALYALHGVIIALRRAALQSQNPAKIAAALDIVEELPRFLAKEENMRGAFEEALEELAERYPDLGIGLERFKQEELPLDW
jgi:hypothetical protein